MAVFKSPKLAMAHRTIITWRYRVMAGYMALDEALWVILHTVVASAYPSSMPNGALQSLARRFKPRIMHIGQREVWSGVLTGCAGKCSVAR
jgi:hypothetical protein